MKCIRVLALAATLLLTAPAQAEPAPADPAALGYAREIVDTIMPPAKRTETAMTMARAIADQMRSAITEAVFDQGLRQIVDAYVKKSIEGAAPLYERHMPQMIDAMVQAYVREFSVIELAQIRDFAKSPAGEHYLSRNTALISDPAVAEANRVLFVEAERIARTGEAELRETVRDYLAKHPALARKIAAQREQPTKSP